MLNTICLPIQKGLIAPYNVNVLLGDMHNMQLVLNTFARVLSSLRNSFTCAFAGLGRFQFPAASPAMALGLGVQDGLENNVCLDREKKKPATNRSLANRIARLAKALGKTLLMWARLELA